MKHRELHNFPSRPPTEILQEIIDLKKRKDHGEPIELPLITVMYSKSTMSGFLADFRQEESKPGYLTIELVGSSDVFFAEASGIEGLIIHDMEKIDYLLYDINMEQIALKKQVSKYEVKKRITEESERLSSFFDKAIQFKISDDLLDRFECFYIKNLIIDLSMTLLSMAENQSNKIAIKNTIDQVVFQRGSDLSVNVELRSLNFTDTLARSYSTNLQRSRLKSAIKDVL